jgi:hypothetical protein
MLVRFPHWSSAAPGCLKLKTFAVVAPNWLLPADWTAFPPILLRASELR